MQCIHLKRTVQYYIHLQHFVITIKTMIWVDLFRLNYNGTLSGTNLYRSQIFDPEAGSNVEIFPSLTWEPMFVRQAKFPFQKCCLLIC